MERFLNHCHEVKELEGRVESFELEKFRIWQVCCWKGKVPGGKNDEKEKIKENRYFKIANEHSLF